MIANGESDFCDEYAELCRKRHAWPTGTKDNEGHMKYTAIRAGSTRPATERANAIGWRRGGSTRREPITFGHFRRRRRDVLR